MSKIYLSPSSQTNNKWTDGTTEAARAQEFSNKIKTNLVNAGHTVYGNKNTMTLQERINESNSLSVDAHVAIHTNAGGGNGPLVLYYANSADGKRLAQCIYTELSNLFVTVGDGIWTD